MRLLLTLALLPALLATACDGCTVPFSAETDATLRLSLGAVDPRCASSGEETRENGDVVTYTHTLEDDECRMSATWSGELVDMPEVREEVHAELEAEGIDPEHVDITVTRLVPTVESVTLRDADNNVLDLDMPALRSYRGSLSVEGEPELIVVEMPEGGDPTEPRSVTRDSPVLAAMATEAYAENLPVEAEGEAEVRVTLDRLTPLAIASEPALAIELGILVEGQATITAW